MSHPRFQEKGFTLFELLVVLFIVGILAVASVAYVQDRHSGAVRGIVDELEGELVAAQTKSQLTLGEVVIHTDGTWTGGNLFLSYQDKTGTTGSTSEVFRSHFLDAQRDHMEAGVDAGNGWYAAALGGAPDLVGIAPTNAPPFIGALANPLFTGGANDSITINGNSKRFTTGFYIAVVGLKAGTTYPGAPMAVLIVPTNGTGVYKFYKGPDEVSWRRM